MPLVVEYASHADKAWKYVHRTLPAVVGEFLRARGLRLAGSGADARDLHRWAQAGRYVDDPGPRDEIRPVAQTLREGGDCEDWAAVLLAALHQAGRPARIVTAGDARDNFLHIYVETLQDGRWQPMDPKGSQSGRAFGSDLHGYPILRYWTWDDHGGVHEIRPQPLIGNAGFAPIDAQPALLGSGATAPAQVAKEIRAAVTVKLPVPPPAGLNFNQKLAWGQDPAHQGAPGHFQSAQDWARWVPVAVQRAYETSRWGWRSVEGYPWAQVWGQFGSSGWDGPGVSLADLKQRVPAAFVQPLGPDDPVINDYGDAIRALSEKQLELLLDLYGGPVVTSARRKAIDLALNENRLGLRRSDILRYLRVRLQGSQGANVRIADFEPFENLQTLEQVNLTLASRWVAGMLDAGEVSRRAVREFAIKAGGNPSATTTDLAAVAAIQVARSATAQAVALDDVFAARLKNPQLQGDALIAAARGLQGSGSIFSELIEDVGRWARRVFITEPGKFIRRLAQDILNAEKSAPWLSQFILRPLGIMFQAQFWKQVGVAMVDGSISSFDEKAVGMDFAKDLTAWGTGLAIAAPFIPQPWGALCAAIAAVAIAGGMTLQHVLSDKPAPQQVTFQVDDQGRRIGPDGLPVDPIQRQAELARRAQLEQARLAALQPDPATQPAGEWRRGSDGLFYAWYDFGRVSEWYWTAVQLDQQGQPLHAWVADPASGQWRQLG